ncbi:hypothetical protein AUG19_00600 [archaeon 13_1_20CM_2_54_9]|nr:MAG: hypothetical protein AUG19_00600 [archaeon 13_1_20CM_2_54_9]
MPLQDDFQREERRSILLVGLSIILLALIVSPVGPLLASSLALLAMFWVIYALGMIVYFSDDLFHPRTRRTARVIGLTCFFVYPFAVILAIVSAAAAMYLLPYPSIINWLMVAVGTSYAILIGGRILRFQSVMPTQTWGPPPSTRDEINGVFRRAEPTEQPLRTFVEKIPRPTIRPIGPFLSTTTGGIPPSLPFASPRRPRKAKADESADQKGPLGQTSRRKASSERENSTPTQSGDPNSITSS